jgi:hypothetical protein
MVAMTQELAAHTDRTLEPRYSIREAANLIGFSPVTCWRELKRGRLGCYRVCGGRVVLIGALHIERYLSEHEWAAA